MTADAERCTWINVRSPEGHRCWCDDIEHACIAAPPSLKFDLSHGVKWRQNRLEYSEFVFINIQARFFLSQNLSLLRVWTDKFIVFSINFVFSKQKLVMHIIKTFVLITSICWNLEMVKLFCFGQLSVDIFKEIYICRDFLNTF